jgi:hypothetical protein
MMADVRTERRGRGGGSEKGMDSVESRICRVIGREEREREREREKEREAYRKDSPTPARS